MHRSLENEATVFLFRLLLFGSDLVQAADTYQKKQKLETIHEEE